MKKGKILIITPGFFPLFGGMEEQCYLLAKAFLKKGYKVDILTEQTEVDFLLFEVIDGISVYRLRHVRKRNIYGFAKLFWELVWFLWQRSNEYDFCIIRTLTFHSMVLGLLKFFGLRLKTVVTAETGGEYDDIIALKNSIFCKLLVFLANRNDYLNGICDDNIQHYRELGFDMRRVRKIYNGLDIEKYEESVFPKKIRSFIFMGRIIKTKGVFDLIKAFKKVSKSRPELKLFIGGDGADKDQMLGEIKDCACIKYVGFVERSKREWFYGLGDCFIQPSFSESFSMVVYEAAIRKKYIISTAVADLRSIFREKILFYRKRDVVDLAKKIIYMSKDQFTLKTDYKTVIDKIDINTTISKYINLFKDA